MFTFKLPDLGEGIHEGEILKWHVKDGEVVQKDAPLVDVETDKAAVTIPAPVGGRVVSLGGKVGEVVTVGQVLVTIDDGEASQAATPSPDARQPETGGGRPAPGVEVARPAVQETPRQPMAAAPPPTSQPRTAPAAAVSPGDNGRSASLQRRLVPAAPATRRLARELGVALQEVPATGPGGRVTLDDVRGYAERGQGAEPEPRHPGAERAAPTGLGIPFLDIEPLPDFAAWGPIDREPLRSIRRRVARKMVTSNILVPHVAHMDEADVTLLEEFRQRERLRRDGQPGGHLTLLAFVIKAVTAGLKQTPAFNASLDPFSEEIIFKRYYHLGIAADTGKGLVVPVVRDTDRKSILQISREIEEVVRRARDGSISVDELRGGTFTITNIGPLGGTALIPAINYPEVAILGMGKVQEKPVVREGQIVIRKILPLTLAFDHRIADGADAARFVTEMVRQLSDPNLLLIET